MSYLKEFFINFFELANAMSIYILVGLIFAGFLKEILPNDFIIKHLGKGDIKSVIKATILGIPMPVCSCSVIPLAKSFQKEGASKGAVQSFLISTPITGVDSIFATYSFFGWFFTIYRVITSIIIAIVVGVLQNIFSKEKEVIFKSNLSLSPMSSSNIIFTQKFSNRCPTFTTKKSFSIKRVFLYAFNTLFSDIAKALFIGLIIGALFATLLPKELLEVVSSNLFLTYILVILISLPLYICATSSLPIGASLYLSGLPLGAVFIFLSAGPATNSVTMSVVKEMFGKRSLIIYLATISILSILFAYILDIFFGDLNIKNFIKEHQEFNFINYMATAIMLILIAIYWRRK